jgi:hypothetical protein
LHLKITYPAVSSKDKNFPLSFLPTAFGGEVLG